MEQLEKALQRNQQRLSPSILEPATVQSAADIKRLVMQLDPAQNPPQSEIPLGATMEAVDDKTGRPQRYAVSASTRSKSKRDILIEGLDIIKNRIEKEQQQDDQQTVEVNGIPMRTARIGAGSTGRTWVDPLIRQWLGGHREGIHICWDLKDGYIYRYNIYEHKLTRIEA